MGYGNDNVSITGTEMKFALSLELPGGLTMDEVGFEALFYVYSNRTVTIPKSGMTRIDSDTYVVTLDTSLIGGRPDQVPGAGGDPGCEHDGRRTDGDNRHRDGRDGEVWRALGDIS